MSFIIYQVLQIHFTGQIPPGNSLGLDILIYLIMATGFIILGFLASNFFNKARLKSRETEIDSEKERLERRIHALEKEIKHLYSKDDEQTVIINDLKKQLQKGESDSSIRGRDTSGSDENSEDNADENPSMS